MTVWDAAYGLLVGVVTVLCGVLLVVAGVSWIWAMAHPRRALRIIAAVLRHRDISPRMKSGCVVSSVGAVAVMSLFIDDLVRAVVAGDWAAVKSVGPAFALGLGLSGLWLIPVLELSAGRSKWPDGSPIGPPWSARLEDAKIIRSIRRRVGSTGA